MLLPRSEHEAQNLPTNRVAAVAARMSTGASLYEVWRPVCFSASRDDVRVARRQPHALAAAFLSKVLRHDVQTQNAIDRLAAER
ncbi:protein of unknown function [Hyphomicrobium sp. MC1]|nr:protein of unknown function [Hyphomicrobium sp. MC1]